MRARAASAPFVPVNCAGLTETLLESELFGYVKGSFTGALSRPARQARDGRPRDHLPRRNRGDDAADAGPAAAVPRDRRNPEGRIRPDRSATSTSASSPRPTATSPRWSRRGEFREDLFYRINVIHLMVPPLRARREDIPVLVEHFLTRFTARTSNGNGNGRQRQREWQRRRRMPTAGGSAPTIQCPRKSWRSHAYTGPATSASSKTSSSDWS